MVAIEQLKKDIETRNIILKLEAMYQRELKEGFGINSPSMKQYLTVRDEGLIGVLKMEIAN